MCCCVSIPTHDSERRQIWTNDVVKLSLSHPFLLHQILAVAALHCHSNDPCDTEAHAVSLGHRATAVEYVQPALATLAPQSVPAMFAFAGLTTIYSFGEATVSASKQDDWIQHMLDCIRLNRGISAITRSHRESLRSSVLGPLIAYHFETDFERLRELGLGFQQHSMLSNMISTHETRTRERDMYLTAARWCLEFIALLLQSWHDKDPSHLINAWPNMLDELFLQCLENREPLALLIIGHYAAMLSLRPLLWWTVRWPSLLLDQIDGMITLPEMREALAWPGAVARRCNTKK